MYTFENTITSLKGQWVDLILYISCNVVVPSNALNGCVASSAVARFIFCDTTEWHYDVILFP